MNLLKNKNMVLPRVLLIPLCLCGLVGWVHLAAAEADAPKSASAGQAKIADGGTNKTEAKSKGKSDKGKSQKGAEAGDAADSGSEVKAAASQAGAQAAVTQSAQGLSAFMRLLPLNERNLDVKIPSFQNGRPSSLLRAESMTRLDDENMLMEKMDIRMYGEVQEKDMRIQLVTGNFNLPTQVLSSDERSRVSRADFQLEGDSMIFDTVSGQGKLVGRVEMVIFDTDAMTKPQAPDPANPAAKGAESGKTDAQAEPEASSAKAGNSKKGKGTKDAAEPPAKKTATKGSTKS